MHTYLHYLQPAYLHTARILSSLTPAYYPQGNILHKPACTEYTQTHLHMHASYCSSPTSQEEFLVLVQVCTVHMQCGHGIPECPAYGHSMYVLVGKVGGTGNMGSMVNIWGNAKKERETRSKKRKSPHFAGEFLVGGRTGTGTGTGCC